MKCLERDCVELYIMALAHNVANMHMHIYIIMKWSYQLWYSWTLLFVIITVPVDVITTWTFVFVNHDYYLKTQEWKLRFLEP